MQQGGEISSIIGRLGHGGQRKRRNRKQQETEEDGEFKAKDLGR